jgi:hypothetical protein
MYGDGWFFKGFYRDNQLHRKGYINKTGDGYIELAFKNNRPVGE